MYDFESVSVSSYEAASLAPTLAEKSADGWEVVAIVSAGSDVVAYLRKKSAASTDAPSADAASGITDGTSNTIMASSGGGSAADLLTPTSVSSEPASPADSSTADDTTPTPAAASTDSAGWGAAAAASAAGESTSSAPSTTSESTWGGSAQQQSAPATPSVPAGWYADPAGRFELRYWDGNAWTEHVSRQGQQYTDPPVA